MEINNLSIGVVDANVPSKDQVAAAIAAVRSRNQSKQPPQLRILSSADVSSDASFVASPTNSIRSANTAVPANNAKTAKSGTTASLLQQSSSKLGPLTHRNYSFSSEISDGTSALSSVGHQRTFVTKGALEMNGRKGSVEGLGSSFLSEGAEDGSNAYGDLAFQSNNAIHKFSDNGENRNADSVVSRSVCRNNEASLAGRKPSDTSSAASTFAKYGVSPSIAQIRARRALSNYHNANRVHCSSGVFSMASGVNAINRAKAAPSPRGICSVTSPITPTSLLTSSTGISEVSTETSSSAINVDMETVKNVSHFIDSLHQKGGCVAETTHGTKGHIRAVAGSNLAVAGTSFQGRNGALPPTSPRNLASVPTGDTPQATRTPFNQSSRKSYPSLANARNMIASSPVTTMTKDVKPSLHVATGTEFSNTSTLSYGRCSPEAQDANYSNKLPTQLTNRTNAIAMAKKAITSSPVLNVTNMNGPTPRIGNVSRREAFSPISNKSSSTMLHSKLNTQLTNHELGDVHANQSKNGRNVNPHEIFSFSTDSYDSSSDDSEENGHVPESTRVGIGAFIDSIKKKQQQNAEGTKVAEAASTFPDHGPETKNMHELNVTAASANPEVQGNDPDATADAVNPETQEELDDFIRSMTMEKDARNRNGSVVKPELPRLIENEIQMALSKVESEESSVPIDTNGDAVKPRSLLSEINSTDAEETMSKDSISVITEKVQKAVKSDEPLLRLGDILEEANKLGLSLDLVTKIYKRERFKTTSLDDCVATDAIDEEKLKVISPVHLASCSVKSPRFSPISSQNVGSPQDKSPNQNIMKPSISSEVEHEMKELSLLCERATALFVNSSEDVALPMANKPRLNEASNYNVVDDERTTIEEWTIEFEGRLKDAAKSTNPSIKLAKILAEAKKRNLPVSHLVEVYKNERIALNEAMTSPQDNKSSQNDQTTGKDESFLEVDVPVKEKRTQEEKTPEQDKFSYREELSQEDHTPQVCCSSKLSEAEETDLSVEEGTSLSCLVVEDGTTFSENDISSKKPEAPETTESEEEDDGGPLCEDDGDVGDTESELDVEDEDFAVPGLSNTQIRQLKQFVHKAEEIRETDLSPKNCFDDAIRQSHVDVRDPLREEGESKRNKKSKPLVGAKIEDVDAFFHRFSINDGNADIKSPRKLTSPSQQSHISNKKSMRSLYLDYGASPEIRVNCSSLTDDDKVKTGSVSSINDDDFDGTEDIGRKQVAELRPLESGDAEVFFMEESALEVSFVQATEKEKRKARKRAKREKYLKKIEAQRKKTPRNKDKLPGNLGLWRSPWERNRMPIMSAGRICNKNSPGDINGVAAAAAISARKGRLTRRICLRSVEDRTKDHEGYFDIDFYSLYEATEVSVEDQDIDLAPWEYRDVRQRFLHEKSVESRNWFGERLYMFVVQFTSSSFN